MKTAHISILDPVKGHAEKTVNFYSVFELAMQLKPLLGDLPKGTKVNIVIT